MKKLKRIILFFIVLFFAIPLILNLKVEAKTVAQLQAQFPTGAQFNEVFSYSYRIGNRVKTVSARECDGFASRMYYEFYGRYPMQYAEENNLKLTDVNQAQPGDMVRYNGHTVWILERSGNYFTVAEANYDYNNTIRWYQGKTLGEFSNNFAYIIKAPYVLSYDKVAPVIQSINVGKHATTTSFTISANITDNNGIGLVRYTVKDTGETGSVKKEFNQTSNNMYDYTVKKSEHTNKTGMYKIDVFVLDKSGNEVSKTDLAPIPMGSTMATNLGNFKARIVTKSNTSLAIAVDGLTSGSNVSLKNKDLNDNTQIWNFEKVENDAYKITNVATGLALDVYGARNANETNVELYTPNNTDAQKYCIMNYNNGYRLVPVFSPDWKAVDITGGVKVGRNVQLYEACNTTNGAQTFIMEKVADSITLNKTQDSIYVGNTTTLSAVVTPTDVATNKVTWTSSNSAIAEVDEKGIVTAKGEGTATITATTQDGTNISKSCTITVIDDTFDPNAYLVLNKDTHQFDSLNEQVKLEAKLSTGKLTSITWESSNLAVAQVDSNGVVTAKRSGFANIIAKSKKYGDIDCLVYVNVPVELSDGEKAYVGDVDGNGVFDINDKTLILEWFKYEYKTPDHKLIADIDNNGVIDANDGNIMQQVYSYEAFKPGNLATIRKVTLSKEELELEIGKTEKLTASIIASNTQQNKTITWSSNNTSVATVDQSGNVTALKVGTAEITAKSSNGKVAKCRVIVNDTYDPNAVLELNKYKYQFNSLNEQVQLEARLSTGKLTSVTWESSNTDVAQVDENGIVTAKRGGFVNIYAVSKLYGKKSCWIYVSYPVTLSDGEKAYVGDLDGNGRFSTNDSADIMEIFKCNEITKDNLLLGDINGDGKVNADDASIIIDVFRSNAFTIGNLATIRRVYLGEKELELEVGTTYRLYVGIVASNTQQDKTITWSSNNTNVATVDKTGTITAIKMGTAEITAKSVNGKTATCKVTVKEKEPEFGLGDVDKNGVVNATDYAIIARYLKGYENLTEEQIKLADVDKNGTVNATDYAKIARYLKGYETLD